jgi:hypothetical protein
VHAHVQNPLHERRAACTIRRVPTRMDQRHTQPSRRRTRRLGGDVYCILFVSVLLMGLTVAAAALSQPALAVVTGTGCVSLCRRLARSLLS